MTTSKSSSCLHQFSWEELDNQMVAVLYRADRRFAVKRYVERVLANSSQWQQLAEASFSNVDPIAQAYTMTENEVKLMHHLFSWHLNGTLKFPIVGGLDQLLDWEDVLDFIERARQVSTPAGRPKASRTIISSSMIPTIPVGVLPESSSSRKAKTKTSEPCRRDLSPTKTNKNVRPQRVHNENTLPLSSNHWVQINNTCLPYIMKSHQSRLLPYQVILDCDLLSEEEQTHLAHLTFPASTSDRQLFERIIPSTDFTLTSELLLIDLYHLIFSMTRVVYVKLLANQRHVNKSYKTVLAHCGGTAAFRSQSIPFITLGKLDYLPLDCFIPTPQPSTKSIYALRRHAIPAQAHEIDYLRLVLFYQQKSQQDESMLLSQDKPLLISINEVQKHFDDGDLRIEMSLQQLQQLERDKMSDERDRMKRKSTERKTTKRKASTAMTDLRNMATERS